MKKTYISPALLVMTMNLEQQLCTISGGGTVSVSNKDEDAVETSKSLTRRQYDVWGEEEEEEEQL